MRVIIAGPRHFTEPSHYNELLLAIRESKFDITEVVSGCALGVDTWGETWAQVVDNPIVRFPANWERWGKYAGPIRNREMADYADALIALWDGKSKGTSHMIKVATEMGIKVHVRTVTESL